MGGRRWFNWGDRVGAPGISSERVTAAATQDPTGAACVNPDMPLKSHVRDPQTGDVFKLKREGRADAFWARVSALYLLAMLAVFFWLLFDIWSGKYCVANRLGCGTGYEARLATPTFHFIAYTIIGGAMGGIVNGIRSLLFWHGDLQAFGGRYIWKYIYSPWLGATLALFVYAIIRSGIQVAGGGTTVPTTGTSQSLFTLALGVLVGYGSRQVFIWLDDQVNKLFKITPAAQVTVPDLIGKTKKEAEDTLKNAKLNVGNVTEKPSEKSEEIDRVIEQSPIPNTSIPGDGSVSFTIAVKKTVPNLIGKTREEAEEMLKASKLIVGDVGREAAAKKEDVDKVVKRNPLPHASIPIDGKVSFTVAFEKEVEGSSPNEPKTITEGDKPV